MQVKTLLVCIDEETDLEVYCEVAYEVIGYCQVNVTEVYIVHPDNAYVPILDKLTDSELIDIQDRLIASLEWKKEPRYQGDNL